MMPGPRFSMTLKAYFIEIAASVVKM